MSLSRAAFTRICMKLPATTLHQQWDAAVAKVGGKVYALHGDTSGTTVFKVSELGFAGLTSLDGVTQAPYFAKGQWVAVAPDAVLPAKDLTAYIAESHRLIAGKLTRKLRAELGLC
jgi:predicted DNA-binding protein (MmcQ/YjbR family)